MSAAFCSIWQTCRLGLRSSCSSKDALLTLKAPLSPLELTRQQCRPLHNIFHSFGSTHSIRKPVFGAVPAHVTKAIVVRPGKRSRWASRLAHEQKTQEEPQESNDTITQEEINKIFKQKMDADEAIRLLEILQKQRVEGTLDQPLAYPDIWVMRGLKWLRRKHPMDEDAAINVRIDREIELGGAPQSGVNERHSVSQFEKRRRENKMKAQLEDQRQEAEKKKEMKMEARQGGKRMDITDAKTITPDDPTVKLAETTNKWATRYREKIERENNETITEDLVNSMPLLTRLGTPTMMLVAVVTLSVLLAQYYVPPSRKARLWPDIPPAAATVITLIGMNALIFCLWRVPPFWRLLTDNFIMAHAYPRALSVVGAGFSHQAFHHLALNMVGLWLIGTRVHEDIGRGRFLAVYLSSIAVGAYLPLFIQVVARYYGIVALGASAGVAGLMATACVLHEGRTVTIPLLPSELTRGIDTGLCLVIFMALEIRSIRKRGIRPHMDSSKTGAIEPVGDFIGHLAGYATGITAAMLIRYNDPKFRDMERTHWFTRESKGAVPTEEPPPPPVDIVNLKPES